MVMKKTSVLLVGVEDRDDVGVVEARGGPRLAQEELHRLRMVAQVLGQAFERHDAAEPLVARLEHDAHAAAPDLLENLVASLSEQRCRHLHVAAAALSRSASRARRSAACAASRSWWPDSGRSGRVGAALRER